MKRKLFIVAALALSVIVAGCANDDADLVDEGTPVEDAVDETEDAAEETEDAVEEAVDETEDAIDEAEDEAEDAIDEAEEQVDDTADVWPADFMPDVPEFEGTIFKVDEKDVNHMYVAFKDVTQEEGVEYVEALKEAGFTEDADEYIASTVVNFKGFDEDGNFAKFRWSENGYATINMTYPEEE